MHYSLSPYLLHKVYLAVMGVNTDHAADKTIELQTLQLFWNFFKQNFVSPILYYNLKCQ